MDRTPEWPTLMAYIKGTCTPRERRTVEVWMHADPSNEQAVEQLRAIWEVLGASPSGASFDADSFDADEGWRSLRKAMRRREAESARRSLRAARAARSRTSRRSFHQAWAAAAAVLALLLAGVAWLIPQPASTPTTDAASYREVITERGERASIQLADGTEVMLNVDSRLRLPPTFGLDERVVHLTGEAYFDVATDSSRSFIVKAHNANIDVHGTAFNVRGYPDDEDVRVAVAEGRVSLRASEAPATQAAAQLRPGELGRLSVNGARVATARVNVDAHVGWTQGRLVFDGAPLDEVATHLERWYNIRFEIREPSLDSLRLTANLKSQSVRDVMDVIAASLGIQYEVQDGTVVLVGRRASSQSSVVHGASSAALVASR
jgi:transmembrane sensor